MLRKVAGRALLLGGLLAGLSPAVASALSRDVASALSPAVAPAQQTEWQPGVAAAISYAHTRAGVVSFDVRTAKLTTPARVWA